MSNPATVPSYVIDRIREATAHGAAKRAAKAAPSARKTPTGATTEVLLDLTQQDKADMAVALGRAEAQVEALALALRAMGVPADLIRAI